MRIRFQRDAGVSSVLGTMLILCLLIMLASLFAVIAVGTFTVQEKPINAHLSYLSSEDDTYIFEMTGGDLFAPENLKCVYRIRDNATAFEEISGSDMQIYGSHGSMVGLGDHIYVKKPTAFHQDNRYLIWLFFDTRAGMLISSGELPPETDK